MRKFIFYLSFLVIFIFVSLIIYVSMILIGDYAIDEEKLVFKSATTLIDEKGEEITKIYVENRQPIAIETIPKHVIQAFTSIEDANYYKHHGIDFSAVLRATIKNMKSGSKLEGGSTITQQLVKNTFLTNEKTFTRKIKELFIAMNLEYRYSKNQILEWYLNQVYFGHGTYGIQAAAHFYFNKNVSDLTVPEGALLAALLKAPSTYSPILHPKESLERRNVVLEQMRREGVISAEEAVRYKGKTLALELREQKNVPEYAPYIDLVLEEAERMYHFSNFELLRGGYTIVVPLKKEIQKTAYDVLQDESHYIKNNNKDIQSSFVLLDNKSGGVVAAFGGRNYVSKGINRVLIQRQPGSTFKPIAVYAPAIESNGFSPYSLLPNNPQNFAGYKPKNYQEVYSETISIYDAIIQSANIPAVYVLDKIGINTSKKFLEKVDISLPDSGLSVALGGLREGVSPLQLAAAYRTFSNKGEYSTPHFISKIIDSNGEVLVKYSDKSARVFSEQTAWYITKMLQSVVENGTAVKGRYDGVLAGKTGSTNIEGNLKGTRDAWFAGYTPSFTGAIWLGYDRTNDTNSTVSNSSVATIIYKKILQESVENKEKLFVKPKGVKDLETPIRLASIQNFTGEINFSPLSLFTAEFSWEKQKDSRIIYRLYRKDSKGDKLITEVKNSDSFSIKFVNVFSNQKYYLVPYDQLTKKEGVKSEVITLSY